MKMRAFGQVGFAFAVFGLGWGCTMTAEKEGETTQDMAGATGTVTAPPTPVVAPPMTLTNATPSCDLREYFPDADGAAGGWTTGTCGGAANYPWLPPSVCTMDEMFDNWEGPSVPNLGTHCRALMAGSFWNLGRGSFFMASTSPPSRGMTGRSDGPFPYNACVCNGLPPPNTKCSEYGYEYVICPWSPKNNLDVDFTANHTAELNQHIVGYCNPGTTTPGAKQRGTYGVIYAYDPKCPNCVPCDGT